MKGDSYQAIYHSYKWVSENMRNTQFKKKKEPVVN